MKKLKLSAVYSQRDSQHKDKILGFNKAGSQYTIGNFGCLITTVDAYLNALGNNISVSDLNDKLKQVKGYAENSGLFIYDSLKSIWPDIKVEFASQKWSGPVPDSEIAKMRQLIDQGKYLIVEVDFYPATVNEDMHWVGVYGYDDDGDLLIFDPWTGTLVPITVYGDPKRVIYKYFYYNKPLEIEKTEDIVCYPKNESDRLKLNSDKWDGTVVYLEIQTDPKDTPLEKVKSTIGGFKSRLTDLGNQLTEATAELGNRLEQVSRLKTEVTDEQNLRKDVSIKLNEALKSNAGVVGVYEGQLKAKQQVVEEYAKAKGELVIELANMKSQLEKVKDEAIKNMTNKELLAIVINRAIPFLQTIAKKLEAIKTKQ